MDHHPQCPLHEDYELTEQDIKRIDPSELLDLVRAADNLSRYDFISIKNVRVAIRPFGWLLDCTCSEIAQAEKEYQQEMRQDR